jgi:WhiB family redox-sensing transcriptional regulator
MVASSLTLTPPDAEWMRQARCAGYWDLMESTEEKDERAAKDLCQSCPVWEQCRAWTLSLPPRQDVAGVAGGLTQKQRERQRRRIRRSRPPEPKETKRCPRCRETKSLGQFYVRPERADGRDAYCRTCCVELTQERRAAKEAAPTADQTTDVKGIAS